MDNPIRCVMIDGDVIVEEFYDYHPRPYIYIPKYSSMMAYRKGEAPENPDEPIAFCVIATTEDTIYYARVQEYRLDA